MLGLRLKAGVRVLAKHKLLKPKPVSPTLDKICLSYYPHANGSVYVWRRKITYKRGAPKIFFDKRTGFKVKGKKENKGGLGAFRVKLARGGWVVDLEHCPGTSMCERFFFQRRVHLDKRVFG